MNYKNIKVEKRENYAIIEIANNKNNSLDQKTLNEIGDATKNLNKSKEIKCIGLIGGPKFFSPGADIKELEKLDSKKAKKQKLFSKVDDLQKIDIPIISFVEGYALGGGFELALSSDLIIASSEAKFGLPEINLGLIPGIGGTQKTKKFTSNQNVKYLAMSGEIIDAETAMKYGIVSQIIPKENFKELLKEKDFKKKFPFLVMSFSKKNVIRGLHLQTKNSQGKFVSVIKGKIFDVVVDLRKNSKTFGMYISTIISEKNSKSIFIPPGFAHGFLVLSKMAVFHYKCTDFYNKEVLELCPGTGVNSFYLLKFTKVKHITLIDNIIVINTEYIIKYK